MVDLRTNDGEVAGPGRPRLVLADDDPFLRAMLGAQLESSFDVVGLAEDAEQAIELVSAQRPDVAILDVNMPAGGAIRATREIHEGSPETAIVILSLDESSEAVIELLELGAITYLRKGIDGQTLVRTLGESIEAHRHLRERGAFDRAV